MAMGLMYTCVERYSGVRKAHGLHTEQSDMYDGLNIVIEVGGRYRANKVGSKIGIFRYRWL